MKRKWEQITIAPSDDVERLKNASYKVHGTWWYKLPEHPPMPIIRSGRYWMYKVPCIDGIQMQVEDVFYNALLDLHLSQATIYNTPR